MRPTTRLLLFVTALPLGTGALAAPPASADVGSKGKHQACYNNVAIREREGPSPARDNLTKGQTFVVTGGVGREYVYGYKLVNNVHGWVLSSSIDKCC